MKNAGNKSGQDSFLGFLDARVISKEPLIQATPATLDSRTDCDYDWAVAVSFTILGSGSSGNCAYIETEQVRFLIDAGFSARQIKERLAGIGRSPETLNGILLTHEHSDHAQGLTVLCRKISAPVYCNRFTKEALDYTMGAKFDCRLFTTGAAFSLGDVTVETFSVPHDAQDPVGFLIHTPSGCIGLATDLGHATRLVVERVRAAHVLVLETNHDVKLLQQDTRRPWSVKQRILSRHGHLSNEAASAVAEEIASAGLRHIYLGHLSRDCNRPELAIQAVAGALHRVGATHIHVEATSQDTPNATLVF